MSCYDILAWHGTRTDVVAKYGRSYAPLTHHILIGTGWGVYCKLTRSHWPLVPPFPIHGVHINCLPHAAAKSTNPCPGTGLSLRWPFIREEKGASTLSRIRSIAEAARCSNMYSSIIIQSWCHRLPLKPISYVIMSYHTISSYHKLQPEHNTHLLNTYYKPKIFPKAGWISNNSNLTNITVSQLT